MVRKLSRQRRAVIALVAQEGSVSPQLVSGVLGMSPGAARKLLYSMLSDDELASSERGIYTLPEAETATFEGDVTGESAGAAEDVTPDVTATDEPRTGMPILGESLSGTYVYSHRLQAMIPRENKGYR